MPRPIALLLLLILLAGPFLAQAEAAADLTRALAGLLIHVEPQDGGVGDDPIVAPALKVQAAPNPAGLDSAPGAAMLPNYSSKPPHLIPLTTEPGRESPAWFPAQTCLRQAWLQTYLI